MQESNSKMKSDQAFILCNGLEYFKVIDQTKGMKEMNKLLT